MEKEPIVEAMFQSSIYVELGDGRKALFWTYCWLQGQSLLDLAPCLCSAVGARIKGQRTVAQALSRDQWIGDISGALMVQVLLDYLCNTRFINEHKPSNHIRARIKSHVYTTE